MGMDKQTYVTRADDHLGEGVFDSIRWLFETHLREDDTGEFNFAMLYGNEDCPTKADLWREKPYYDTPPDRTWTPPLANDLPELSDKTLIKLRAAGIASVGQLTQCTKSHVFKILSQRREMLNEVEQALQARGLAFNKGNRRGRKPFLGLEGTRNEGKNVMVSQFDHQIIRRMLEDGMRHSEIAHIVGCSRERVRQLDKKWFGKCGMDRARELSWERLEAAAQRRDEELQKEIDRLFQTHPFVRGARERGFEVTILEHGISPTVLVNGHCCLLRKLYRFQGAKGKRRMYYRIHGPRLQGGEIDFYVHALGDTIMIIPPEKMPTSDTSCFVLEHTNNMGAWSHRHDWPNYINAWHYLEKKK